MVTKKSVKKKVVSKKTLSKVANIKKENKVRKVNWVLTLIMSIFFGALGVDRFIMGHISLGLFKLAITIFTLGIFSWVWWVIDIVLIAIKYPFDEIKWE